MAGKIVADTLEHSTAGSVTTNFVVAGTARCWNNQYEGTTVNDSFNQSSMTDNAQGDYRINFTSTMANNVYMAALCQTPHDYTYGSHNAVTGTRLNPDSNSLLTTGYYDQHFGQISDANVGAHKDGPTGGAVFGDLA